MPGPVQNHVATSGIKQKIGLKPMPGGNAIGFITLVLTDFFSHEVRRLQNIQCWLGVGHQRESQGGGPGGQSDQPASNLVFPYPKRGKDGRHGIG